MRQSLGWIILVAVILRVAAALYMGNIVVPLPGIHDQISYHGLAQRVLDGYGFSFGEIHWPGTAAGEPTAHWSYLYTLFLTVTYLIADVNPIVPRILQAVVVGILYPWLTWRIGCTLFGSRAGLIAAALSAIYFYFVYYAASLMTEPFYILGILWTIDCALRMTRTHSHDASVADPSSQKMLPTRMQWLELGLALGFTLLLRQVYLLFVPFLILWIWWNSGSNIEEAHQSGRRSVASRIINRQAVVGAMQTLIVLGIMILPWTIRNYLAFDTFVPINTNSGFAFFWGNHPIYGTEFPGVLPSEGPSYQELIPAELRVLNEAQLDKALLQKGLTFIQDDPIRYLWLSLSRIKIYFKFWPSTDSSMISNVARVGSFGLMLPFMLWGLWLAIRDAWRQPPSVNRAGIVLLLMFGLIYTLIHVLIWTLIRYRLPVDAVLLVFAGYAMHRSILPLINQKWKM